MSCGSRPRPDGEETGRAAVEETDRLRGIYDALAPRYDRVIAIAERVLFGDGRRWACGQARGRVLEVAIGTGRNLPYYPPWVHLTGMDLSSGMLQRARRRPEAQSSQVVLRVGDAQHLVFADDIFDTVVATLSLCSIPDDRAAGAEMTRVLRPGGRLLLLDHVASPVRAVRWVQRLIDPVLVRWQGDHLLREPEAAVLQAGLVLEEATRSRRGIVLRLAVGKPD